MVHTRTGRGSPQLSSAMGSDSGSQQRGELRQRAATPLGPASGGGAGVGSAAHTHLQRAGFLALLCYLAWFGLILGGILAYEGGCRGITAGGQSKALLISHRPPACRQQFQTRFACHRLPAGEPILVKSSDLPLHHFDKLFRTVGSLLLFAMWGVRAAATRLLPRHFDRASTLLWAPLGIYLGQAVVRMAIYQLHVAGGCWQVQGWALLGPRGTGLPCLPRLPLVCSPHPPPTLSVGRC